jgi:hypothetical protein
MNRREIGHDEERREERNEKKEEVVKYSPKLFNNKVNKIDFSLSEPSRDSSNHCLKYATPYICMNSVSLTSP